MAVGVFYDKPEGNLIFSQLNIPPVLDNVTYENFNLSAPSSGAAGAVGALGDINAIDPNLTLPRQVNYSIGFQRELGGGYFVEATYVGNRGDRLLRQPDVNRADLRRAAGQRGAAGRAAGVDQFPASLQGLLGHPDAAERCRFALQLAAVVCDQTPRRSAVHHVVHARQGDDQRERQR